MAIVKIEGIGKEAKTEINKEGGKQSASPLAMHLLDPEFIGILLETNRKDTSEEKALNYIAKYMLDSLRPNLIRAIMSIEPNCYQVLLRVSKVLKEGAEKYEANNWRLIPQEEHINHAMIHLLASALGDTQDEHKDHALCRLMMADATRKSENFSYTSYRKPHQC